MKNALAVEGDLMELWDIYDKNRNKTGKLHARGNTLAEGEYHLVIHVWIMNSNGQVLISKRHTDKPFPCMWECVGGSVITGESSLQGALREVKEEIGIDLCEQNGRLLKSERRDHYNDFYDVWLFEQDIDIKDVIMQADEVIEVKWVTKAELDEINESGKLVHTLGYYREVFKKYII